MAATKHNRKDPARAIIEAAALDLIKLANERGTTQSSTFKISGHPLNSIAVVCTPTDKGSARTLQIGVAKVGTVKVPLRSFRRVSEVGVEKVPGTAVFAVTEKITVHSKNVETDIKSLARSFTRAILAKLHKVEGSATKQRQQKLRRAEALDAAAYA